MNPERWRRVKEVFGAALEAQADRRAAVLEEACAGDADLRSEVERLLDGHADAAPFLETPAAAAAPSIAAPTLTPASPLADAERLGPYRILGVLGEGGMGTVYQAEQESPRRTVALKVLRGGVASPAMMRRFELEAAVLARLQHPGIAQIYEAGTAGSEGRRRPYFAMELVRGQPLTEYARAHDLNVRARVELLIRVADAVQHAHMKGVIHRDLKPANILVNESGQPKVLDFGVARLTDSDLRVTTLQTGVGQLVGTIPYMSPEQVAGDPHAVDTRSDVYALGVVLFELLAGRLPYDLENRGVAEAVRMIQESPPTRLSTVGRALRGDLDTIAGKALERDKQRRYQAASDLAGDLRRWLAQEPILARPPSTIYQLRKFAARNRVLVAGVGAVFLALVAGVVGVTLQRDRARTEAAKANAVSQFLIDMLESADPTRALGEAVTVRQSLDGAAERIAAAPAPEPEVDATIRATIGDMYWRIGALEPAQRMLTDAIDVGTRRLGEAHAITLAATNNLAMVYKDLGLLEKTGPLVMRVYETRLRTLGERHPDTLSSMNNAARWLAVERKWDEAIPLMRRVVDLRTRVLGADHRETLCSFDNLGRLHFDKGDLAEAEPIFRRAIDSFDRVLGTNDPDTLVGVQNLAELLHKRAGPGREGSESANPGAPAEAEVVARRAADGRLKVYGPDNVYTLQSRNLLGRVLQAQGRASEAEPLLRQVVDTARRVFPPDNPKAAVWIMNHAECLAALGRFDEAEAGLLEAHRKLAPDPVANAARLKLAAETLARFYDARGRPDRAAAYRSAGDAPPGRPGGR